MAGATKIFELGMTFMKSKAFAAAAGLDLFTKLEEHKPNGRHWHDHQWCERIFCSRVLGIIQWISFTDAMPSACLTVSCKFNWLTLLQART